LELFSPELGSEQGTSLQLEPNTKPKSTQKQN